MSNLYKNYNPDILETIANLSNDEVFTPPKLANKVLDLLPEEVWSNPNLTFLDPAVKTGIFLREITRRLIDGLADQIPDLQERVNHILTKQVFGIGITELTTLMARRTVYCSMYANGPYSICTEFDDEKGNIIFPDTEHTWDKNGRCEYCGANSDTYGGRTNKENYAYPFIHDNFEKEFGNMKFDVIIGNPPYHLSDGGGGNSSRAKAIYNLFIDKAISMKPKYISMITPSRWMTDTAEGISSDWVKSMINSNKFKTIVDFENGDNLFNDVRISGGVNYFLWDIEHNDKCNYTYNYEDGSVIQKEKFLDSLGIGIVIRDPKSETIIKKVEKVHKRYYIDDKNNFSSYVSPGHYFDNGVLLSTSWRDYKRERDDLYNIKYYVSESTNKTPFGWVKKSQVPKNKKSINLHKVYIPAIHGGSQVIGLPRYGEPGSVCSQTYLVIGYNQNLSKKEALNIISYIHTKFFRFMVGTLKKTQAAYRGVYRLVPLQDFSKPWTDEELYKKYKLTQEEIDYIEEKIAPMPSSGE